MKILCVIDNLGPGGAQRQLVEIALGLKHLGHEVCFMTYYFNSFYYPILEKNGIIINYIKEPKYFYRLLKIRLAIRRDNFDGVISFLEGANFICEFAGLPSRKWKLIVGERSANPNIYKSFKLLFFRWFHLFADYVVSNSNANLEIVKSVNPFLQKKKCKIIYNLVDFNRWKPLPEFRFRKNNKTVILIAAHHTYTKNLNGLIEGVKLLDKEELDRLEIKWYGGRVDGTFPDDSFIKAKQKISTYGLEKIFSFYLSTNEIVDKIQNADAVGLFSFYEGLPNIVCEGMACAKPVICSRISDIQDFLYTDIKLLFNPLESHSIRDTLSYLLKLSDEQLSVRGRENLAIAQKVFDKNQIIQEYIKLLEPLN